MEQLVVMFVLFSLAFSISAKQSGFQSKHFISCLVSQSPHNRMNHFVFSQQSTSFPSILESTLMNLRFNTSSTLKPIYIITPQRISHIQATVICCKIHGLQVRVRSGGHDYEGLSFTSQSHVPFIMIDLVNLRRVIVNAQSQTAWVQVGATLGELLYYYVANHSGILAFPAGVCPTVGTGGHISGGGQGTLTRKYGLAADNVLDAVLVDVNGRILTRESMGEDLFWAIAGGGAANFGVIFKWKLRLVPVPPKVTVFNIHKTLEQNATQLIHKWQEIAPKLDKNLYIRLILSLGVSARQRTVVALFNSLYLGTSQQLVPFMKAVFPELGLEASDCKEMTWIESVLFFIDSKLEEEEPIEVLLDRNRYRKSFTKGKTDFVENPISKKDLDAILRVFMDGETQAEGVMIMDPYGGRMAEIPDSQTPFPHRAGTLYNIQYFTGWQDVEATSKHLNWIVSLYTVMTPFVSNNPRTGYLNYRDLALGSNPSGNATYFQAKIWGTLFLTFNAHVGGCFSLFQTRKWSKFYENHRPVALIPYSKNTTDQ